MATKFPEGTRVIVSYEGPFFGMEGTVVDINNCYYFDHDYDTPVILDNRSGVFWFNNDELRLRVPDVINWNVVAWVNGNYIECSVDVADRSRLIREILQNRGVKE